jgi:hypothetical protein
MFERLGYRSALYLSALIAVVHCSFFMYLLAYSSRQANRVAIYVVAAVAVLVGLWLLSKIARYVGAVFYAFSAVAVVLPLLSSFKTVVMSVGAVWSVTMGVLSLAAALILVFSKPFAKEFAAELEKRPIYKKHLLTVFTALIVLAAVAATLNDIVNLASD